jgi:hypothetical protein
MSSVTNVANIARRVKSLRSAEEKLDQLAMAIEQLARLVGALQNTINDTANYVRRTR